MKKAIDELGPGPGLPIAGPSSFSGKSTNAASFVPQKSKLKEEMLNSKKKNFELPKIFSYFEDNSKTNPSPPKWASKQADITDYFNYGFTEETWKIYCQKIKKMAFQNSIPEERKNELNEKAEKVLQILNDRIPLDFGGFGLPNDDSETKKLDLDFTEDKIFYENFWSYKSTQEFLDKSLYPDDPSKMKSIEKLMKNMEERNKDSVARRKQQVPEPQVQPLPHTIYSPFFPPKMGSVAPPPQPNNLFQMPSMPPYMMQFPMYQIPPRPTGLFPDPMSAVKPVLKEQKPDVIKKPVAVTESKEKKAEEKEAAATSREEKHKEPKEEKSKKEEKHRTKDAKEKKSKEDGASKQEKPRKEERRGSERDREHKERDREPERDREREKERDREKERERERERDSKAIRNVLKQPENTQSDKKHSKPAGEEGPSRLWMKGINGIKTSSSKKDEPREQDQNNIDRVEKTNLKDRSRSRYDSKGRSETNNGKSRSENEQPKNSQNGHAAAQTRLSEVRSTGIIDLSKKNNNIKEIRK